MSRPESEVSPRFKIAKEEINERTLVAMPLSLRKQTVAEFDREFRIAESQERERVLQNEGSKNPELAEYLANARLLFVEKEFALAQNLYRAVLKLDSKNELAIRGMAECAKRLHRDDEAIQILKKLAESHKTSENFRLLGQQLYAMEYNQDALEAYRQSLLLGLPDGEELFVVFKNMGNILLRLADPDGAEEFYNKAYTLHPESDELLVNFGSLALYRGDYERALARFREAVRLNDKNDKAWVGLAMIHREHSDHELAWANVEKALDVNPANESAIKLVSEWATRDNEIDKAISRLEVYVNIKSEDALISMWLAKFLFFAGRMPAAKIEIEKALDIDPHLEGGLEVLNIINEEIRSRGLKLK